MPYEETHTVTENYIVAETLPAWIERDTVKNKRPLDSKNSTCRKQNDRTIQLQNPALFHEKGRTIRKMQQRTLRVESIIIKNYPQASKLNMGFHRWISKLLIPMTPFFPSIFSPFEPECPSLVFYACPDIAFWEQITCFFSFIYGSKDREELSSAWIIPRASPIPNLEDLDNIWHFKTCKIQLRFCTLGLWRNRLSNLWSPGLR